MINILKKNVDSKYRNAQSKSSSDFSVELNENLETPEEIKLYVTDTSISAVWKSTEVGFYEYIYVVVFNGNGFSKGGCCVLRIPERQMTAAINSTITCNI